MCEVQHCNCNYLHSHDWSEGGFPGAPQLPPNSRLLTSFYIFPFSGYMCIASPVAAVIHRPADHHFIPTEYICARHYSCDEAFGYLQSSLVRSIFVCVRIWAYGRARLVVSLGRRDTHGLALSRPPSDGNVEWKTSDLGELFHQFLNGCRSPLQSPFFASFDVHHFFRSEFLPLIAAEAPDTYRRVASLASLPTVGFGTGMAVPGYESVPISIDHANYGEFHRPSVFRSEFLPLIAAEAPDTYRRVASLASLPTVGFGTGMAVPGNESVPISIDHAFTANFLVQVCSDTSFRG
jgi:hypothetical protein